MALEHLFLLTIAITWDYALDTPSRRVLEAYLLSESRASGRRELQGFFTIYILLFNRYIPWEKTIENYEHHASRPCFACAVMIICTFQYNMVGLSQGIEGCASGEMMERAQGCRKSWLHRGGNLNRDSIMVRFPSIEKYEERSIGAK